MEFFYAIWGFFSKNVLQQPAFFIGLIVLVGYILLKKPWYESLAGFIKASVGYLILTAGATGLVSSFKPIIGGLKERFNVSASMMDPYAGQAAIEDALGHIQRSFSSVLTLLLLAFVFNILVVRFQRYTKMRALFTTGHVQVQQSATAFWLLLVCFPELGDTGLLLMMSLALGLYWAVGSNLTIAPSQRLTDGAGFCIGHQQMFGVALFSKLSEIFFKPKPGQETKKLEDIKLPGWLSIFNENMVATTILMTFFFGVILATLGQQFVLEHSAQYLSKTMEQKEYLGLLTAGLVFDYKEGTPFFTYILLTAMKFTVYLSILQLGVRTFVAELTESFHGISNRWLPGAVPAIDCAATYGFGSQNAITLGFMFGALGQFLAIGALILMKSPAVIIAGFIPMFFDNATIGLYANRHGGYKAALIMPFIAGITQVLGSAFIVKFALYVASGHTVALEGGYLGMWDWAVLWPAFTVIMKNLHYIGFALVILVLIVIPQIQYRCNREGYFLMTEDYEAYKAKFPEHS